MFPRPPGQAGPAYLNPDEFDSDDDPLNTDLIVDFELWDQPSDYHYQPDNSNALLLLFDKLPPNNMDADQLQLLLQGLGTTLENLNNTMANINTVVSDINIAMGDINTAMNGVNIALGTNNGLLTTANQTNQALGTILQTMTNSQGTLTHTITNFNPNPVGQTSGEDKSVVPSLPKFNGKGKGLEARHFLATYQS
ncbi:hypothetical protein OF83DRAFT_1229273 [Amylostereum chailletii]|nr:hypothetical protein OF83DRAFT_1229273 [Amylostereum chailletii]